MALSPGTRLGPFEIQSALGSGGMGDVYRARDVKLGRDVALKLLPDSFATDPDRLARFQREAHVLASLNHPHIAHIYGLDDSTKTHALVMELVEGRTLAARIAQGPVPLEEALTIACEAAEALEAAHEKGVIHRDLKPANVMITHEGVVKILDFGLATIASAAAPSEAVDATQSPTLTMAATRAGMILGTAAYMSPEQAAGRTVDKRADIWSFGVMLWELLTGKRLFEGETVSHTLADVLRAEIDFTRLPRDTPPTVRELLRRCLDRDVKSRLRDIGEARVALRTYLANPASSAVTTAASSHAARAWPRSVAVAWGVAALALAGAGALAVVHLREQPPAADLVRFQIEPPEQTTFLDAGVLSPDGRQIAFEARGPDGGPVLWVRALDALGARALSGTEGVARGPFWSPDSRSLAFAVNGFPGRLKRVDVSGGPPQTVAEYSGNFFQGAWSAEGAILFGVTGTGLMRVAATGGTPSPVTRIEVSSRQEIAHGGPTFLPDGRHFLYYRASRLPDNRGIYLGALDTTPENQDNSRLLAADSDPVYVPASNSDGGFLLFLRERSLMAQSFDGRSQLNGTAMAIAEEVGGAGSYGWISASASTLAFRTGLTVPATAELIWFDRQGKRLGETGTRAAFGLSGVQLSPDDRRVVVTRAEPGSIAAGFGGGERAWTAEVSRGIFSRLNPGDGTEDIPVVSPNGRVAFGSTSSGTLGGIYWMPADGVSTPEPLVVTSPRVKHPNDFSPDGKFLIYDDHGQQQDLWILPIEPPPAGGDRVPIPFLVTRADESRGQFSPDGKWIAYTSNESGRYEVYVQGFAPNRVPAVAVGKWQISTAGGSTPRWRADGSELYYMAPGSKLMAVPITVGSSFEPGVAFPLFETNAFSFFSYDVSRDGRFLVYRPGEPEAFAPSPITVVLNWQAGLKR